MSRVDKQLIQLSIKKINKQLHPKWAENLNKHFPKEDIQMVTRPVKRGSTSLIIREMQIKITMRYDFKPVKMAFIKNSRSNKCRRGCGEREPSCTVGGGVSWCSHSEQYGGPQVSIWSSSPAPGQTPRQNADSKTHIQPYVHSTTVCNSQVMEATSVSINR